MLVLALVALAVLTVPLSGGRWAALGEVRLRGSRLLGVALAMQVIAVQGPDVGRWAAVVHVVSYLLAGWFVLRNRDLPGLWLIALGGLANGVTILLNGGTLPASAGALAAAGLAPGEGFVNSGIVHDPVLPWLGDVFAWPAPLPLANVFSVGDVLLVTGAFCAVHLLGRRRDTLSA